MVGAERKENCACYAAMVVVQVAYGGSNILMKIGLAKGLNQIVFVVYRHLLAMILLAPFAYVLERNQRPSLSLSVIMKIFVLAALGSTIHLNVFCAGLAYTSPTVASALSNVIPSLTFIVAVLLGMEKVNIRISRGQAKVVGTLICIGGSLIFTFWKGGFQFKGIVKTPLIDIYNITKGSARHAVGKHNWIKGAALIFTSNVAYSAWLILQGVIYKVYPARLSMNVLICFFASLQSSFLALFFARNPAQWRLDWNVQLLTIIYGGIVISGLVYYLHIWCISKKGPVFAAMFSPLQVVVAGIFSALVFAERVHLGSLVGAFFIIVGLYCVLWAKRDESVVEGPCENGKAAIEDDKNAEIHVNDETGKAAIDDDKMVEIHVNDDAITREPK